MNNSKETFYKVFGLIIVTLLPTLFLYLLLGEFISGSQLEGKFLGTTVTFTGPLAFYVFLILSFRKWAVIPFQKTWQNEIAAQRELYLDYSNDIQNAKAKNRLFWDKNTH